MNKLLPHVLMLTCTKGRHFHVERVVRCFLEQDYNGKHTLLIYNNSSILQELGKFKIADNKRIILINKSTDSKTNLPYRTLGAIYNDALSYIPNDVDIVNGADDDDIYLPNHISEGVKGLMSSGKKAYKPKFSWYLTSDGITPIENTLEPSIFVKFSHLKEYGYFDNTVNQHHKWINPLLPNDIYVDPKGKKTFIYTWNGGVFKTSGDPMNDINFQRYENFSTQHGDSVIEPCDLVEVSKYYYLC